MVSYRAAKTWTFYQKDKQHGLRTIWYENGKKRLSAQFVDDMMEGNSKGWFPSGQQQFDYNFQNNLEHGVCTEWNEQGKKISEIRFDRGVPAQDLLTGQRIVRPAPEETEEDTSPENVSEPDTRTGLDKIELPPVPLNEELGQSKDEPEVQTVEALDNNSQDDKNAPTTPEAVAPPPPSLIPANQTNSDSTEPQPSEEPATSVTEDVSPPPPPPQRCQALILLAIYRLAKIHLPLKTCRSLLLRLLQLLLQIKKLKIALHLWTHLPKQTQWISRSLTLLKKLRPTPPTKYPWPILLKAHLHLLLILSRQHQPQQMKSPMMFPSVMFLVHLRHRLLLQLKKTKHFPLFQKRHLRHLHSILSKIKFSQAVYSGIKVAARQGLEPQLKVPKTSVLPLHHQANGVIFCI